MLQDEFIRPSRIAHMVSGLLGTSLVDIACMAQYTMTALDSKKAVLASGYHYSQVALQSECNFLFHCHCPYSETVLILTVLIPRKHCVPKYCTLSAGKKALAYWKFRSFHLTRPEMIKRLVISGKGNKAREPQEVKMELAKALQESGISVDCDDVELVLDSCRQKYCEEQWGPKVCDSNLCLKVHLLYVACGRQQQRHHRYYRAKCNADQIITAFWSLYPKFPLH